jgi:hypothetical protein
MKLAARHGAALALALACALVAGVRGEEERGHCTALGFGRLATASGSTLLAHTDDRRVSTACTAYAAFRGRAPRARRRAAWRGVTLRALRARVRGAARRGGAQRRDPAA